MTAPGPGTVTTTAEGAVATVTLSHPGRFNAMTGQMWDQLAGSMAELGADGDVRVVVIRGAGGSFSAGADLRELLAATASPEGARRFCVTVARGLLAVARCPVPTLAVLQRHVTGGGAEIALAADLRLAQEDVLFGIPMGRLGVVPDRLTLGRLTALGGPSVARRVLLAGQSLDAQECRRVGLVDDVVPADRLDAATRGVAESVLSGSAYPARHTKAMLLEAEQIAGPGALVDEMVASLLDGGVADNVRRFLDRPRRAVGDDG